MYDHTVANCCKQYGAEREERGRWVDLGHLKTLGFSKGIWCGAERERWREREGGRERDMGGFGCSKWYGAEREGGRERWADLGRLMTAGLSQDIWCHV